LVGSDYVNRVVNVTDPRAARAPVHRPIPPARAPDASALERIRPVIARLAGSPSGRKPPAQPTASPVGAGLPQHPDIDAAVISAANGPALAPFSKPEAPRVANERQSPQSWCAKGAPRWQQAAKIYAARQATLEVRRADAVGCRK